MAHTLLSRSNELLNFARNINLDESNSSSDAGDVLIRATKIHFPEQSYEGQRDLGSLSTISNKTDNVKITVKKLRDVAQPSLLDEPPKIEKQRQARKQEHRHVPPALQANLPSVSPSGRLSKPTLVIRPVKMLYCIAVVYAIDFSLTNIFLFPCCLFQRERKHAERVP